MSELFKVGILAVYIYIYIYVCGTFQQGRGEHCAFNWEHLCHQMILLQIYSAVFSPQIH